MVERLTNFVTVQDTQAVYAVFINGLVEKGAGFLLSPFLHADCKVLTWRDVIALPNCLYNIGGHGTVNPCRV